MVVARGGLDEREVVSARIVLRDRGLDNALFLQVGLVAHEDSLQEKMREFHLKIAAEVLSFWSLNLMPKGDSNRRNSAIPH